ncbi:MAG: hypothetical protein ACFFC0_08255 [Promethearchaeota archaeon]
MSEQGAHPSSTKAPVDLRIVCMIVGALALFAPFNVSLDTTTRQTTFWALTWIFVKAGPGSGFLSFGLMEWIVLFPFGILRVVFVYQMVRYYRGWSTRNRTILVGVLAENPLVLLNSLLSLFMWPYLIIPTPLMLVGALVFLWFTPYPAPKTPFDDQAEPDMWWEQNAESPVGQPNEPLRRDGRALEENRLKCPRCGSEEIGREMHPGSFGIRARFVYSCRKCRNQWEG